MGLTTAIIVAVAALVMLALGVALLVVCRALATASAQLNKIMETVGTAADRAEPAGPVLASIRDDLAAANNLLIPLLTSKLEASDETELAASAGHEAPGDGEPSTAPASGQVGAQPPEHAQSHAPPLGPPSQAPGDERP